MYRERCPADVTEWHHYAFEWTADGLAGFVGGADGSASPAAPDPVAAPRTCRPSAGPTPPKQRAL